MTTKTKKAKQLKEKDLFKIITIQERIIKANKEENDL